MGKGNLYTQRAPSLYNSRYLYMTSPDYLMPPVGKQIQADWYHTVIANTMTSAYVILYLHNREYILNIIVLKNRPRLRERFQITSTKWKSFARQSTLPHRSYATLWNTAAKKISRHRSSHILETQVCSRLRIRPTILLLQIKPTPQTLNTPTYTYTLPYSS
jgi:hypothetical protein